MEQIAGYGREDQLWYYSCDALVASSEPVINRRDEESSEVILFT